MDANRYNKVQSRAIRGLVDAATGVSIYRLTSEQSTAAYLKVLGELPKGTPRAIREYLRGWWDCFKGQLAKDQLEFCYVLPDGRIVCTHQESPRHYEKMGLTPRDLYNTKGRHAGLFWKGTDKAFYLSDDEVEVR